jgi:hypothetical protein
MPELACDPLPPGTNTKPACSRSATNWRILRGTCRKLPRLAGICQPQFVGKELRLSKVEYAPKPQAAPIPNFYMGKNTPERKDCTMDKLVVLREE